MAEILIIDDNKDYAEAILHVLELAQHKCTCVETGEEGLNALQSGGFDVCLLDLGLPDMSGVDFLDEINRRGGDVPIIAMTGHPDITACVAVMKRGARDFLVKGPRMRSLYAAAIKEVLGL